MNSLFGSERSRLPGWRLSQRIWIGIAAALLVAPVTAQQVATPILEVVTVTATKRNVVETVQDVPVAVTAYGSTQLDSLITRDLSDLSYAMPNVQLDDVATIAGVAHFSIRGLGINSSIPSIDPTVGVFVDGMYMGITSGVLLDMFDLESVEVLRGPQGLLFGRNVTGGAVLINTKDPGDEFAVSAKTAVDARLDEGTGPNY